MQKRTLVTVAITFAATSLFWIAVVFGLYFHFYGDEPPFRVVLNHPTDVPIGTAFDVVVAVEHSGDDSTTVGSIDIYDSFLEGFEIVSSEPAFTNTGKLLNFTTLWYESSLRLDSPLELRLKLRATKAGRHGGQLDVCTPSEVCTTVYATIAVAEAG